MLREKLIKKIIADRLRIVNGAIIYELQRIHILFLGTWRLELEVD